MTEDQFELFSKKMNAIIALLLKASGNSDELITERGKAGTGDLARYLAQFGLDAKEIGLILGVSVQSVRTQLTPSKRKK